MSRTSIQFIIITVAAVLLTGCVQDRYVPATKPRPPAPSTPYLAEPFENTHGPISEKAKLDTDEQLLIGWLTSEKPSHRLIEVVRLACGQRYYYWSQDDTRLGGQPYEVLVAPYDAYLAMYGEYYDRDWLEKLEPIFPKRFGDAMMKACKTQFVAVPVSPRPGR